MPRPENEAAYVVDANLRRGGGTFLSLTDQCGPAMAYFAKNFPAQLGRALGKVGSVVRLQARQAMEQGGLDGQWPQTVGWKPRGRRLRRGTFGVFQSKSKYGTGGLGQLEERFGLAGASRSKRPYGKLYSSARYILKKDALRVTVGWVNDSAAAYGKAVQAGLRGPAYSWPFQGEQPVTRSMRRALAAMGIVLKKGTAYLRSPERPLMRPLFDRSLQEVPGIINEAMQRYLAGGKA